MGTVVWICGAFDLSVEVLRKAVDRELKRPKDKPGRADPKVGTDQDRLVTNAVSTKQLYDSAIGQVQRCTNAQFITVSGANMCTNMFIKRVP